MSSNVSGALRDVARLYFFVPMFVLQRSIELALLRQRTFTRPLLDLGCGDGQFGRLLFGPGGADVGLDSAAHEVERARRTGVYGRVVEGDAHRLPFPDGSFATVFSNSTLEHIDDVAGVVAEVGRVLAQGGEFVVTAPTERFPEFLASFHPSDAETHRAWVDRTLGHVNYLSAEDWERLAAGAGLRVTTHRPYFARPALGWFDRFLRWQTSLRRSGRRVADALDDTLVRTTYGRAVPHRGLGARLAAAALATFIAPIVRRDLASVPAEGAQRLVVLTKR